VTGTPDENLNDENTLVVLDSSPPGDPRENPDGVFVPVSVIDNDIQRIIVDTGPSAGACDLAAPACPVGYDCLHAGDGQGTCFFRLALQEGGPSNAFTFRLEFPPALPPRDDGVEEVQLVFASAVSGPLPFVLKNQDNYADPVTIAINAPEEDGVWATDTSDHSVFIYVQSDAPYAEPVPIPTDIIDDENTIITTADYAATLGGAADHTKRQNVRWSGADLALIGADSGGDNISIIVRKDLLDPRLGPTIGTPTAASPVETAELDGTDFGLFSTDGLADIAFSRVSLDLQTVFVDKSRVVSGVGAEFWTALDHLAAPPDTRYGLMYRNTGASPGLYFLTVDASDGSTSSAVAVTTSGGVPHEMPNLHRTANGWLALYTAGAEAHCVTMDALGGSPVDVTLNGFPGAGEYVSSVYNGTTVMAVYAHTTGIFSVEINEDDCSQVSGRRRIRGPASYLSTPFIAYNGVEYAVAFDTAGTPDEVGVLRLDLQGSVIDELWPLDAGERPSPEWLGDRWAVRYDAGGAVLQVGSMQTSCDNGVLDGDEQDLDCGGSCPRRCALLWAADGQQGFPGSLYEIDPETGGVTTIGALPEPISALAFNPEDGFLYGVTSLQGSDVYRIDPGSGAGALVGTIASVPFTWSTMNDWDYLSDGTLVGSRQHECSLYDIDISTGLGVSLAGIPACFRDGIAADDASTLYHLDQCGAPLVHYDTSTFSSTLGATISCPPSVERNFHAAAWSGGLLYALRYDRPNSGIVQNELLRIHPPTGFATVLATGLPDGLHAIAGAK
jgi:hypothetical protein